MRFTLYSKHATAVMLCLFRSGEKLPCREIALDCTGEVWNVFVDDLEEAGITEYTYRVAGPSGPFHRFDASRHLLDPYAKAVVSYSESYSPRGVILDESSLSFDWQGVLPPRIDLKDLIIYEMHVGGFTKHPSSCVEHPGTYLGLIEKIPYLKSLGINAVELLPIHEFDPFEDERFHPETGERLINYWGYSSMNFFAPCSQYAVDGPSSGSSVINEFRTMVRELHRHGIEVILDVVYNHTGERGIDKNTCSFAGIDNASYYLLDGQGKHLNFSGCGNTFACNSTPGLQLILDSLRYWSSEMGVDGFRFDLASILGRGNDGGVLKIAPVIDAISTDPLLADTKLIAEPWDAGGLYEVGKFYPSYGKWAEWNGSYRDVVRRFIKGEARKVGSFATRVCGSEDLYAPHRKPYHSLNFITAHDGFTLQDLVSYNEKHNIANGEENRDGSNDNFSWNCGAEGETKSFEIHRLRERQKRNFYMALMVSQGVPMILMGDEYGHSKQGNNNTWCQDNALNWFDWREVEKEEKEEEHGFFRFCKLMNAFRHAHPILRRSNFLTEKDIDWYDFSNLRTTWKESDPFLAWHLKGSENIYIAFYTGHEICEITLPPVPQGKRWYRVIDTFRESPDDFLEEGKEAPIADEKVLMHPYSALLFKAKKN